MIYNWTVNKVSKKESLNNLNDVITEVMYSCELVLDDAENIVISPVIKLEEPTDVFTEYSVLSESEVLKWLPTNIKENVEKHLVEMMTPQEPPVFEETLPW